MNTGKVRKPPPSGGRTIKLPSGLLVQHRPGRPLADSCPKREEHTPTPSGYAAFDEWARLKSKTHRQTVHPICGLQAVWVPRAR
jgi:hypothetical protein